jgi:hypothetical protein
VCSFHRFSVAFIMKLLFLSYIGILFHGSCLHVVNGEKYLQKRQVITPEEEFKLSTIRKTRELNDPTTVSSGCSPCYNNEVMPNYDKFSTLLNTTCSDVATYIENYANSSECEYLQVLAAVHCDCPSIPPSYESSCTLCFPDETLSSSLDPVFEDDDITCRGMNALATSLNYTNTTACEVADSFNELLSNYTEKGRATCCT